MQERYLDQKLSCSAVVGGEYYGVGNGGYRVDWAVVAGEAAMIGVERREGTKIKKREKNAKGDKARRASLPTPPSRKAASS